MIRIEAVHAATASDETLRAIHTVEAACAVGPWRSADDAIALMRHPASQDPRLHWLALDGDEPIGMVRVHLSSTGLAWLSLNVLPAHRRRGVGRALLGAARAAAGERPVGAYHSTPEGAAFARAFGAVDDQRDVRSVLTLPARLPEPALAAGYAIRSWVGPAPDDLVESYAAARNAVDDAPTPEGESYPAWTVELVREIEESLARRGREARVTVALAGEEVAAFTDLRVTPGSTAAATDDTATVAEHRRKGLCRAVKTESLRLLQRDWPQVTTVDTMNAEQNTAMRAVNTALGFVPVVTLTTAILRPG